MEKKCLNGASMYTKITGENASYRAPILRMEDVLEMDAIVTAESKQRDQEEERPRSGNADDEIEFSTISSLNVAGVNRLGKGKGKRKRIFAETGSGVRGYDSFLSDEDDLSDAESKDLENSASRAESKQWEIDRKGEAINDGEVFTSSENVKFSDEKPERRRSDGRRFQSRPKKKYQMQKCASCSLEKKAKAKKSFMIQSESQYKSYDSDISNTETTGSKHYTSPSEVKTKRNKTVVQKVCNCYNRQNFGKNINKRRSRQDVLENVHSRWVSLLE